MNLYYPDPVDSGWVRAMLLEYGTRCEAYGCGAQATHHFEGRKTVAYVCDQHHVALVARPNLGHQLCGQLWERFQDGFNFIRQVEASGGTLLANLRKLEDEEKAAQKQLVKDQRAAVQDVKQQIRTALKQGKVGAPDDELATARGAQSPPRDPFQLIFRVPELGLLSPVILPPHEEPDPLIQVRLL